MRFTTDLRHATQESQAIFIAVGTPQSETGDADLSYVDSVASEIARSIDSYKVIVEKSTVPVYTNDWIRRTIERNGVLHSLFDVASNPEFLREGTAVKDFLHPDRIVLGADSEAAAKVLAAIYRPLSSGSYYQRSGAIPGARTADDPPPVLATSAKAAEIIKHASNAFLAMKISFINVVANLCEAVGGGCRAGGSWNGARPAHWRALSEPGHRLWRLLLSQRCRGLPLCGAGFGRRLRFARGSRKNQ